MGVMSQKGSTENLNALLLSDDGVEKARETAEKEEAEQDDPVYAVDVKMLEEKKEEAEQDDTVYAVDVKMLEEKKDDKKTKKEKEQEKEKEKEKRKRKRANEVVILVQPM